MSERSVFPNPETPPWIRWAALVLVLTSGLFALWFQVRLPFQFPPPSEDAAAAAFLSREGQPSDVVLLFPWWTERARMFVPPRFPVVGYWGSDSDPLEDFERIWVLGLPGLPRADHSQFEQRFLPGRRVLGTPWRFGPYELTLYANDRYRPVVFSSQDPASAVPRKVYWERPGSSRVECPWDGAGFRCESGSVSGPQWHEVFYRPVRCLHVRPPGGDGQIVLEMIPSALGEVLTLEAGIIWEHAPRKGAGQTPVFISAGVGEAVGRLEILPGEEGLKRVEVPVPNQQTGLVRVGVRSLRVEDREVCLSLKGQRRVGSASSSHSGVLP